MTARPKRAKPAPVPATSFVYFMTEEKAEAFIGVVKDELHTPMARIAYSDEHGVSVETTASMTERIHALNLLDERSKEKE